MRDLAAAVPAETRAGILRFAPAAGEVSTATLDALGDEAHLHRFACVREACHPACPRRGRPTGIDGRCACEQCAR